MFKNIIYVEEGSIDYEYLIEEAACDTCGRCAYYEYSEEDDAPLCKQFPNQGHKACMRGMLEYYRKQVEAGKK